MSVRPSIALAGLLPGTVLAALLPAGAAVAVHASSAVPHCGDADLKVSYRHTPGGDGMNQRWGWIVLRNRSHHRCATGGFGGVSYVGGGNGTQIGASATRFGGHARLYVLKPGQTLRSRIDETNEGVYDRSECHPRHVDGFRVYVPNSHVSQYVAHPTTGCASTRVHLLTHAAYHRR
jgi:hypothetical protein